ncbi:hypothetical protein MPH_05189 [Macrophomina phaseolina MS6]|uniref:Uncharacterized protein n=1 Tax=Macrophomina phaseolina (strain MS6) TaxID=1126212 RepID=K2RSB0_MACPH|nr:hypothetical protein MPH_05189 [Macrophomina phaseolina MS6]
MFVTRDESHAVIDHRNYMHLALVIFFLPKPSRVDRRRNSRDEGNQKFRSKGSIWSAFPKSVGHYFCRAEIGTSSETATVQTTPAADPISPGAWKKQNIKQEIRHPATLLMRAAFADREQCSEGPEVCINPSPYCQAICAWTHGEWQETESSKQRPKKPKQYHRRQSPHRPAFMPHGSGRRSDRRNRGVRRPVPSG